ncbi:hypothetical protein [Bailinhaonella thermotolerans]|uniref:hypothetical protein n=1 Tax=Bailinhaonella thermotolerans TaxID=1070861 RepID=UPI0011C46C14|nr:hypothetical protein [Bailinhaonella thermotolerans]
MSRWWNDPGAGLGPGDRVRLDALAALYPVWELSRENGGGWSAVRRGVLGPREAAAGLVGALSAASLAELGAKLAAQDRLAAAWSLLAVCDPQDPAERPAGPYGGSGGLLGPGALPYGVAEGVPVARTVEKARRILRGMTERARREGG